MADKLTDMQKIAALFERIEEAGESIDGRAADLAVAAGLAEIIKQDGTVFAAFNGHARESGSGEGFDDLLEIVSFKGFPYFVIFKDLKTAVESGMLYKETPLKPVLELLTKTPQMTGIQLMTQERNIYDGAVLARISKRAAAAALEMADNGK